MAVVLYGIWSVEPLVPAAAVATFLTTVAGTDAPVSWQLAQLYEVTIACPFAPMVQEVKVVRLVVWHALQSGVPVVLYEI